MENVVIIGSGPAGLTAALYAARANLAPLVLEGLQPGGQLTTTTEIENFPGIPGTVTGPELVGRMKEQACRFGARCEFIDVVSADFQRRPFTVTRSDDAVIECATVIIATGASAQYLGLPSEQALIGRGVSACATCDGSFYKGLPVAVLGGGDTAMEEALYLSRIASTVTLIHRRDEFRASKIMADRVKANPAIRILWSTVVEEFLDVAKKEVTGLRVRNVKTGDGSVVPVAGVFVAIGHKPNTDPFRGQLELTEAGFIVAHHTRTSVPGVFAAGDVQDLYYKQAVTAAGTGCMAALEAERYLAAHHA